MLKIQITSWSGFSEAPIALSLEEASRSDEPQAGDGRPALRLIQGGKNR